MAATGPQQDSDRQIAIGWGADGEVTDAAQLSERLAESWLHAAGEVLVAAGDKERALKALPGWEEAAARSGYVRLAAPDTDASEEEVPSSRPTISALTALARAKVESATPNGLYCSQAEFYPEPKYQGKRNAARPADAPADLPKLGAVGEPAVVVGIVDTGLVAPVQRSAWLKDAVDYGHATSPDSPDEPDVHPADGILDRLAGHGTFVTGTVLRGAPEATALMVRRIDERGVISEAELLDAIEDVERLAHDGGHERLDLLNLSLGGWLRGDKEPPLLAAKLRSLMQQGTLVVAAAGNLVGDRPVWPAAMEDVVAVAAMDRQRRIPRWSSRGDWVDVITYGVSVESAFFAAFTSRPRGARALEYAGWATWSGSSFAAPRLVGAVAQHLAVDGATSARRRRLTPREAYEELKSTTRTAGSRPRQDFPNAWILS
jgi:hypothetical protein